MQRRIVTDKRPAVTGGRSTHGSVETGSAPGYPVGWVAEHPLLL